MGVFLSAIAILSHQLADETTANEALIRAIIGEYEEIEAQVIAERQQLKASILGIDKYTSIVYLILHKRRFVEFLSLRATSSSKSFTICINLCLISCRQLPSFTCLRTVHWKW
jgi:hypothetical protein